MWLGWIGKAGLHEGCPGAAGFVEFDGVVIERWKTARYVNLGLHGCDHSRRGGLLDGYKAATYSRVTSRGSLSSRKAMNLV